VQTKITTDVYLLKLVSLLYFESNAYTFFFLHHKHTKDFSGKRTRLLNYNGAKVFQSGSMFSFLLPPIVSLGLTKYLDSFLSVVAGNACYLRYT
jgi:hypothetical protein